MSRVSIGLPVYNGEGFAERAILSVLCQSFSDFELVIVDNASVDRTAEICSAYAASDPRITYVRNEINIGAPNNFNKAFHLARAPYFKWMAVDDSLHPAYLDRCIAVLDGNPDVVLCNSEASVIDCHGQVVRECQSVIPRIQSGSPYERFAELVLKKHSCFEVFGVVRREFLARTSLIGKYWAADGVLLAELALMGRFHLVDERLFFSGEHPDRSVHIPVRERAIHWWHSGSAPPLVVFPYWRVVRELMRVISRADVDLKTKGRCYAVAGNWAASHWRNLGSDARSSIVETLSMVRVNLG
jgi:glycosyltransferase involved in cell wall biosynthesis